MIYPPEFLTELKERAASRCECERSECHGAPGRCGGRLDDSAGTSWSPVFTGDHMTFAPVAKSLRTASWRLSAKDEPRALDEKCALCCNRTPLRPEPERRPPVWICA